MREGLEVLGELGTAGLIRGLNGDQRSTKMKERGVSKNRDMQKMHLGSIDSGTHQRSLGTQPRRKQVK